MSSENNDNDNDIEQLTETLSETHISKEEKEEKEQKKKILIKYYPFICCLKEIKSLPYIDNKDSNHEKKIIEILEKHGLKKHILNKKLNREETLKWSDEPSLSEEVPELSYIYQPFGSQGNPDFIIKIHNEFVMFLEAKSAKKEKPLYNSGSVHPNYIYVLCSQKYNRTTIYKGSSIITPKAIEIINNYIEKQHKEDEEINELLKKEDIHHRGISYYTRPMIGQKGGAEYSDYFTHKNRERDEAYVFEWVNEQIEKMNLKKN